MPSFLMGVLFTRYLHSLIDFNSNQSHVQIVLSVLSKSATAKDDGCYRNSSRGNTHSCCSVEFNLEVIIKCEI